MALAAALLHLGGVMGRNEYSHGLAASTAALARCASNRLLLDPRLGAAAGRDDTADSAASRPLGHFKSNHPMDSGGLTRLEPLRFAQPLPSDARRAHGKV